MKLKYKCEACQESFDSYNLLYTHTKKIHKLNGKEYYDKFLKKPGEGKCLNCGKETKLHNNNWGYLKYCCLKCSSDYHKKQPRTGKYFLYQESVKINGKYICEICKNHTNCLGSHIIQSHHITCKDYYDKYLKQEGEGICPVCGKETSFHGIMKGGYSKHCSIKCVNNDPETIEKKKETSKKLHGVENWRNPEKARKTLAKHLADGTVKKQEITQSAAETELLNLFIENK